MSENTATEKVEKKEVKKMNIVRGRMPAMVVYMVKFGNEKGLSLAEAANLFGTTVGKIDDIRKGRGFAYITESFAPTQAQKDDAIEYFKKHPDYELGKADKLLNELETYALATPEEAAAFEAVRKKNGGQSNKTAAGEEANAGGGNQRKAPKKEKAKTTEKAAAPAASAEELLK